MFSRLSGLARRPTPEELRFVLEQDVLKELNVPVDLAEIFP
jgi:hypothetical protein